MQTYGTGPWFVFFVCNERDQISFIHINTYPELIVQYLNIQNVNNTSSWYIALMIGPFDNLNESCEIANDWNKCKQVKTRFEKGRQIFLEYQKKKTQIYLFEVEKTKKNKLQHTVQHTFEMDNNYISVQRITTIEQKRK